MKLLQIEDTKENKLKYPKVYSKAVKLIQGSICKE